MSMLDLHWLPGGRSTARIVAAAGVAVFLSGAAATAAPAQSVGGAAHSQPARSVAGRGYHSRVQSDASSTAFWEGTDSWPIPVSGSPSQEPAIGGDYGGYIGMVGNWAYREGCHGKIAWSSSNSAAANTNFTEYHLGIGTGGYWFMGGPGVDPHYNGTTTEAAAWGAQQAEWTLGDMANLNITYPVVFEDVELPGIAPATDNGWNSVYTSPCSGKVKSDYVSSDVDRAEFNGFADYVTSHSSYQVGVYSAPRIWTSIFGTGADSLIPNTYEWTYIGDTSSLSHAPDGWCLHSAFTCADFFGGDNYNSPYALMWQWSGGGGTYNGYGDFDQIDASRTP
jgi:hypothetical protein